MGLKKVIEERGDAKYTDSYEAGGMIRRAVERMTSLDMSNVEQEKSKLFLR